MALSRLLESFDVPAQPQTPEEMASAALSRALGLPPDVAIHYRRLQMMQAGLIRNCNPLAFSFGLITDPRNSSEAAEIERIKIRFVETVSHHRGSLNWYGNREGGGPVTTADMLVIIEQALVFRASLVRDLVWRGRWTAMTVESLLPPVQEMYPACTAGDVTRIVTVVWRTFLGEDGRDGSESIETRPHVSVSGQRRARKPRSDKGRRRGREEQEQEQEQDEEQEQQEEVNAPRCRRLREAAQRDDLW
eukprot:PhM_4_TR3020/c2_g4_i10/m.41487